MAQECRLAIITVNWQSGKGELSVYVGENSGQYHLAIFQAHGIGLHSFSKTFHPMLGFIFLGHGCKPHVGSHYNKLRTTNSLQFKTLWFKIK